MSTTAEQIRVIIEANDVLGARLIVAGQIRLIARRALSTYVQNNYIHDFGDTNLVSQRHRTFLANLKSTTRTRSLNVQNATTLAEVLAIFDAIAPQID